MRDGQSLLDPSAAGSISGNGAVTECSRRPAGLWADP